MVDKYPAGSFFAKVINFFQGSAENVVSDLATQMTEFLECR